jgi:hypothetical protein
MTMVLRVMRTNDSSLNAWTKQSRHNARTFLSTQSPVPIHSWRGGQLEMSLGSYSWYDFTLEVSQEE